MISDGLGPYHRGELEVRDGWRVVLGLRWRPFWIITSVRLPNFERSDASSVASFFRPSASQALVYSSVRKLSPVDMIAQHILASLLAKATATTRSGFLAFIAAIQSARAPLYLWATRSTEVQPTTSILRKYRLPFFVMPPSFSLPPLECWLGVRPRDALKSLADLNALGSGKLAVIAEAISGPMAGTSSNKRLVGFFALALAIFFSNASIFSSSSSPCAANRIAACLASSGRPSSASARATSSLTR